MIFGRKAPQPEVGHDVFTNDEERLGDVAAVLDDHLVVTGGPRDRQFSWRIPRSAIGKIDAEVIHLTLSRGQVLAQGWEQAGQAGAETGLGLGA